VTVKERLIRYLKENNIKQKDFNSSIGVSKGYIGAISRSPSNDILNRISIFYPELNIEWLVSGKGNMIKDSTAYENKNEESVHVSEFNRGYNKRVEKDSVTMPREVFEMLNKLTDTVQSQQRTIELLENQNKKSTVQKEGNVGYAGAG
jgi:transcriptional regulator with XRE-family HTH domain